MRTPALLGVVLSLIVLQGCNKAESQVNRIEQFNSYVNEGAGQNKEEIVNKALVNVAF